MKKMMGLGLVLISSFGFCADKLQPPDVKLGLWETTVTSQMSGLPPIPPEALARMTPEQKARMEAAMKARSGHPTTHTNRHCVTKEQLEKGATFNDERENCTRDVVNSGRNKAEIKFECTEQDMKVNGTVRYEALDREHVQGSTEMVMSGNGHTMNANSTFTSKWVGEACGDVK